jgi:adenylate cyclase
MAAQAERRLVAVMFTDMVGYTALMQADEKTAVERRDRYVRALDRNHAAAAGGTIVQRLGDGSLSIIPSALAAVRAAVAS